MGASCSPRCCSCGSYANVSSGSRCVCRQAEDGAQPAKGDHFTSLKEDPEEERLLASLALRSVWPSSCCQKPRPASCQQSELLNEPPDHQVSPTAEDVRSARLSSQAPASPSGAAGAGTALRRPSEQEAPELAAAAAAGGADGEADASFASVVLGLPEAPGAGAAVGATPSGRKISRVAKALGAASRASKVGRASSVGAAPSMGIARRMSHKREGPRPVSGNLNCPQDYKWLEGTMEAVTRNQAGQLGCTDMATGKGFFPIFFVIGGCPNMFCGMQAVMYSVAGDGEVDFWWVKPAKAADGEGLAGVENSTLSRHMKGPHKNDPGRSKPFYKPLADLFHQEEQLANGTRFGIERVDSASCGKAHRAYMVQESGNDTDRLYLHLVWQEDWTTNPFARSKYIKGKIVYQKDPEAQLFFARQYAIVNGQISLSDREEQPFHSVLPGDEIKELSE